MSRQESPKPHPALMRRLLVLLAALPCALLPLAPLADANGQHDEAYHFGILPYLSPARIEQAYAPLAAAMAREIDHPLRINTALDLASYNQRALRGDFDLALVPPFSVVHLVDERNYIPLARRPSRPARIVVLINSPLKKLDDLRDTILGLPPQPSPVNLIMRINLERQGLQAGEDFLTHHFSSTPACLHKLLVNRVDACATSGAGLRTFERKMGVRLRTLYQTRPFPHTLLLARPDMPAEQRQRLQRFVLGLKDTAEGRQLLKKIGPDAVFEPYRSEDYDIIRSYHQISGHHGSATTLP